MSKISVREMSYSYPDGCLAVEQLGVEIEEGEFACILGPSGCGKTTLLQVLAGLATPQVGTVSIDDRVICRAGQVLEEPGRRPSYMFQDSRLLPWRTVRKNIELAMRSAGVPRHEWQTSVSDLLATVRIPEVESAWPLRLSGGQRQRVALARALSVKPDILLMDEPFSTLDEVTARSLRIELLGIWQKMRQTVVFVTHSIREAVYLADRVYLLTEGPGRLLKEIHIPLARPRKLESKELAELESTVVDIVLSEWGGLAAPGELGSPEPERRA